MTGDFLRTLSAAPRPVIMELKRRSADGDDLFAGRTTAEVVRTYEEAGAPCLSVVTGRWFGGSSDLLREVAELTDLPLLQKDFITSRRHLGRARELGASAVLLTAALLPRGGLPALVDHCLALGLTPFVEVVDRAEIEAVPRADQCIIAVNNKDIRARELGAGDIGRSADLLPAVLATGTPCPASASGIDSPEAAARLLDQGFRGLLIGTELLRAGDIAAWMATLDASRSGVGSH